MKQASTFVLYSDKSDSDFEDTVDSDLNLNNAVHNFTVL